MAYASGAVLIAALAAGCSSGTGIDDSATDSKPGAVASSTAPPGRYRTLPEACRSIAPATLKDLLPGAAELPEAQQEKVFDGSPAVTYDTDRRAGCRWKTEAPDGARSLFVDFERVVSYDPAVSDDDRARAVYAKKEEAADLPSASTLPGGTGNSTPDSSSGTASGKPGKDAGKSTAADGKTGGDTTDGSTDGSTVESVQPRVLDSLGDGAFLDDLLTRAGSTAQHRTVSVVFRTSNVIVTIQYTAQPALSTEVPDSRELQEKAQALGRKLVDRFSE
ncbi:hypothetical protein EES39_08305 [Streptomyces sp. ADI92-24]|uniref:DUF3558 domain-containing protein n=1 Tax=unclassified Streptomyces TaxID=2593676 RepID=UPI000F49CEA5|nr:MULTISPECIES: DUF3558 domain-containing protein [unclassified Streptomyces]MCX4771802.1 DUF3558 domain-containing protein [Streptomyces sp. NBC_01285]ROQ80841.1 hypothetical protein EDD95_0376 [Streptomyces sp. CEV 2-1]RPK49240.1 hypothetical protein EES39_08305 [Streptomyces sp. ADI92-24]